MGFCPICKTSANLEQPSGGDYRRVECRKCGKYQITGSALSMLETRLPANDKKAVARLSHATRLMFSTTDAEWPEMNSVNLDDMLKRPLPTIDRQMTNLLVWTAAQLEDDHLGAVELSDEEDLTGVIGTIDGRRVHELISRAESEDLIEFVPDNCISITTQGWARLSATVAEKAESMMASPAALAVAKVDRIVKAPCNKCRGLTNSWVRAEHTVTGNDGPISWSDSFEVLQCCGCDTLSVRQEHWFSEWDEMDYDQYGRMVMRPGIKEVYFPAPTVRAKPEWFDTIADEVLRNVLDELYATLNAGLNVLASIGVRTLLDRAGYLLIGDPRGGFEGKLSALQTGGHISAHEKTTLEAVADAGNASAHRGYTPTVERLGHIVDIIENFLHRAFVLAGAAEDIRKTTPARQK
ncbi:DUF4145 domain-containing protein [Rhizobium leguminosarum]|uniref:DUF4145 domain-containing protein n=1 Tax=Rhizobium leguminosarum TaxID=384 RepID=UPI001C973361|nr:DUF4145 domain-containing protein [Rhizobium leguminosarum]MBY5571772.1 DUF4145 domain-containing protein [Rhizobium leguminosarum]MBY5578309.1 DUF4145 domain-containing protein [Rhizobium leguminosarum]